VRPAYHAGKSYPSDPAELRSWLDSFSAPPNGPGPLGEQRGALPRALIAPHIDFSRGGPAYAWAYRALAEAAEPPELIVLFGTSHASGERIFTLTRKSYDTPLGRIETDVSVVEALETALREKLGPEAANGLFVDEHLHRGEHSLELQMVWLRHVLGERADAVRIVPILVGSMRSWIDEPRDPATSPEVALVLSELSHIVEGKRLLVIASADLAHVGPRFGDGAPLDAEDRASLERRDQVTLAPVLRGDAAAWFAELAREKDRRNVCGLSPIYSMLQLLSKRASGEAQPVIGRQVAYGQCPADERSTSVVSIASIVFP
jgi:AmmeMemoRadiSam system protein B